MCLTYRFFTLAEHRRRNIQIPEARPFSVLSKELHRVRCDFSIEHPQSILVPVQQLVTDSAPQAKTQENLARLAPSVVAGFRPGKRLDPGWRFSRGSYRSLAPVLSFIAPESGLTSIDRPMWLNTASKHFVLISFQRAQKDHQNNLIPEYVSVDAYALPKQCILKSIRKTNGM
jgi:hypothetical protein